MTKTARKSSPKAQLEFTISRLKDKQNELSDKINRASELYIDHVKEESKKESYKYKQSNIKHYLDELNFLLEDIGLIPQSTLAIVPRSTLERKIERSDFAETLLGGEYVTAISINNYPSEKVIYIVLTPLSNFSS